MTFEAEDFKSILTEVLEQRCAKNPRYSLRSFARDLGLSPSRLSDVLKGRYGLSRAAASEIAVKLGLSESERERFCDLVESRHSRNPKQRKEAAARLIESPTPDYRQLTLDGFQVISEWYHYAILELCLVEDFQSDVEWIAKRLGLSTHVAKSAIERLERLDLLEEVRGRLKPTEGFTASPNDIPSEAIKKFHRQILEKAMSAIDFQSVEERDLSSVVLAIDKRDLPEAKQAIKKFRRGFDKKFSASQSKSEVYCLAMQFFSLQETRVSVRKDKK